MKINPEVQRAVARFGSLIEAELDTSAIPGMATGVVIEQETIFVEGFGLADIKPGTPVTAKKIFRVGSIAKIFTVTAVM